MASIEDGILVCLQGYEALADAFNQPAANGLATTSRDPSRRHPTQLQVQGELARFNIWRTTVEQPSFTDRFRVATRSRNKVVNLLDHLGKSLIQAREIIFDETRAWEKQPPDPGFDRSSRETHLSRVFSDIVETTTSLLGLAVQWPSHSPMSKAKPGSLPIRKRNIQPSRLRIPKTDDGTDKGMVTTKLSRKAADTARGGSSVELDDGALFCEIWRQNGQANLDVEDPWFKTLATASPARSRDFESLFRSKDYMKSFTAFLQAGLHGMFVGFTASLLPDLTESGTRELWRDMFSDDVVKLQRVSRSDVKVLQGKAPGSSHEDKRVLVELRDRKRFLESFNREEQEQILEEICSRTTDRRITSIATFIEDFKVLRLAGKLLRGLLPGCTEISPSIREAAQTGQNGEKCVVQLTEASYTLIRCDEAVRAELGRRQIWLAALRLVCGKREADAGSTESPSETLHGLAMLAEALGILSSRESRRIQTSFSSLLPKHRSAEEALRPEDAIRQSICRHPTGQHHETLFLTHLHSPQHHGCSDVAEYLAYRTLYLAFFGRQMPFNISVIPAFPVLYSLYEISGTPRERDALTPETAMADHGLLSGGELGTSEARLEWRKLSKAPSEESPARTNAVHIGEREATSVERWTSSTYMSEVADHTSVAAPSHRHESVAAITQARTNNNTPSSQTKPADAMTGAWRHVEGRTQYLRLEPAQVLDSAVLRRGRPIQVTFKRHLQPESRTAQVVQIDPSDPITLQKLADAYDERGYYLFDENRVSIPPERVTDLLIGTNRTIFFIPKPLP
ncbi:hypothetical protein B0T11DRAFT_347481 [Plectosphaerella cucumerina]|uniref:Uncharacterized protein n=1 Tax=Plectosphaerella cucumerina TaxID=40658 RepID=A0A8K0TRN8_9PEZI|nr:hypothetical protein B0T11DRAFT_347481 [Plectosphaerella cucumerina]